MKLKHSGLAFFLSTCTLLITSVSCSSDTDETETSQISVEELQKHKLAMLDKVVQVEGGNLYAVNYGAYKSRSVTPNAATLTDEEEARITQSVRNITMATNEVLALYGVTKEDLIDIFGDAEDERIALAGILLANNYHQKETRGLVWDDYVDCAMEAVGINIFSSARNLTKKVAIQLLKEVAKKAAGPVGVGITVAEFSWCLYRNS